MNYSLGFTQILIAFFLIALVEFLLSPFVIQFVRVPLIPLRRKLKEVFIFLDERTPDLILSDADSQAIEQLIKDAIEKVVLIEATKERIQFVRDKYDPVVRLATLSANLVYEIPDIETEGPQSIPGPQSDLL
jgi:hypothetical protein